MWAGTSMARDQAAVSTHHHSGQAPARGMFVGGWWWTASGLPRAMAKRIGPSARVTSTGTWRRMSSAGSGAVLLAVLLTLTGCAMTQSEFAQTAGTVGSAFAAAATTLAYAHHKKITPAYAAASFVSFQ